jgi:hypothetical protein
MIRRIRVHYHLGVTKALHPVELGPYYLLDVLGEKFRHHFPKLFLFIVGLLFFLLSLLDLELDLCHLHSLLVFIVLQFLPSLRLLLLLIIYKFLLSSEPFVFKIEALEFDFTFALDLLKFISLID